MNSSSNDFVEFMKDFKVLKGDEFTHTSLGYPAGSYYIPYEDTQRFFRLYCRELKKGSDLHVSEKHKNVGPILIDLDFRYDKSSLEVRRIYTKKHLKDFLTVYMRHLQEYVYLEEKPRIFILEKPFPKFDEQKSVIKDGIHIMISNIITTPTVQYKIREHVLPHVNEIFEDCKFINKPEDIFDENVIEKNNWLLYGSCKPSSTPYMVTEFLRYTEEDGFSSVEDIPCNTELAVELSIRNKTSKTPIRTEKAEEIRNLEKFVVEDERQRIALKYALQSRKNNTKPQSDDIELVRLLISILSASRADVYDDWIRVGWCLRNIDFGLLEEWVNFSEQSTKYRPGECENMWDRMKEGGLGIKTLHMWAKQDNREKYDEFIKSSGNHLLSQSMDSVSDWDLGLVILHTYQHFFRCAAIKQDLWYLFENHKWGKCDSAYTLRNLMSTEVYTMYDAFLRDWVNTNYPSSTKSELAKIEPYKLKSTLVKNLKNTSFKTKMMKTCADLFHKKAVEEDFHSSLDSKPNLLCFNNGVYDMDTCEFREGLPEDYISLCTHIDYMPYDETDPIYEEINNFLNTVQPMKEKREYIIRTIADSLHGSNREEKVYFWTGEGGNGKSKLYSLLESCMGDYAANISVSYITQKRASSNSASPEMVKAIGRRFVVFQEPEENETVNAGLLKEISGNDKIQVRGLYQEADSFKPQFQVIFICNQLPYLPPNDGGTWRRVRKITFDSKFVQDPDPTDPCQFKIDQDLDQKWPEWKVPFMSLLLHYYKKFKGQPNREPDVVMDATREYQRLNDRFADFVESRIEQITPGTRKPLPVIAVMEAYREWCQEWGRRDTPGVEEMRASVERVWGKSIRKSSTYMWPGLKLVDKPIEID